MADPQPAKCPEHEGGHCWHVVYVPSGYQAGQWNSDGQRCCWCGTRAALFATYAVPRPHGSHRPPEPFNTGVFQPTFGAGGIPLPDVPTEEHGNG